MATRPPFVNPDFEYEEDEFEYDDRPAGVSREMLALFMQDMMNKENGKVAPDTIGVDYFFLDEFVTRDMEYDFALIEQDFLKHCSGKLQEFNEAGWYGEDERWTAAPKTALQKKILRLIVKRYYYSGRDEKKQRTVAEHVTGLVEMLNGIAPKVIIIDPSAAALIVEVRKKGYKVRGADNDVKNGIADVATMLHTERLYVDPECTEVIDEFGLYLWDTKAAEQGEDVPVKENDHAMDAVRYFVHTMRLVPKDKPERKDENLMFA